MAPTEVTVDDFTKTEKVRSTDLSTFGVKLGDDLAVAEPKLAANGRKVFRRESGMVEIYDSQGRELLAIATDREGRVSKIIWFRDMARHLAGESALLLSSDIADAESPLRLRLLGREDSRNSHPGSFGSTVTYSYDKEGIRVIRSGNASPVIHLVPPAKSR